MLAVLEHKKPGKLIEGHIDSCLCYRQDDLTGLNWVEKFQDGGFSLDMRIAQVAPLYESVPAKHFGGTVRVVCYLTEERVRQGQEVVARNQEVSEAA